MFAMKKIVGSALPAIACLALTAGTAHAQKLTVTDAHVQELIRAAAASSGASQSQTAAPQASEPGATLRLTVDDAIKLALDRNLDIAVQRLNPQTFDYSIAGLQSFYK